MDTMPAKKAVDFRHFQGLTIIVALIGSVLSGLGSRHICTHVLRSKRLDVLEPIIRARRHVVQTGGIREDRNLLSLLREYSTADATLLHVSSHKLVSKVSRRYGLFFAAYEGFLLRRMRLTYLR